MIHYNLERTYYKISISEEIKTIDNKIKQNKAQYNLDQQTTKISALSSGNVSQYEFLTGKYVLAKKDQLEQDTALEIFEYFLLGKELKKQTSVAGKYYQDFDKVFNNDEKEKSVKIKKRKTIKN